MITVMTQLIATAQGTGEGGWLLVGIIASGGLLSFLGWTYRLSRKMTSESVASDIESDAGSEAGN